MPESDRIEWDDSEAVAKHPFQFSIRTLLAITAVVAVAGAVAHRFGLGTLVFSTGLTLLILNWRRLFRSVQSGWLQRAGAGAVTCLFAISLFLPAAKGCNNTRIKGWETSVIVVRQQADLIHKVATNPDDREEALRKPWEWLTVQCFLSCLTLGNLMLASALLAPRLVRYSEDWYPTLVALGATACWLVAWGKAAEGGGLLIGYWAWAAAMMMLTAIVPMPRRALAASVVFAIAMRLFTQS